jgi:hypothetical protein
LRQVNLSIFGKKSKQPGEAGGPQDFFSKQQQQRGSLIGRLANSLNPLSWFGSSKAHKVDTGGWMVGCVQVHGLYYRHMRHPS